MEGQVLPLDRPQSIHKGQGRGRLARRSRDASNPAQGTLPSPHGPVPAGHLCVDDAVSDLVARTPGQRVRRVARRCRLHGRLEDPDDLLVVAQPEVRRHEWTEGAVCAKLRPEDAVGPPFHHGPRTSGDRCQLGRDLVHGLSEDLLEDVDLQALGGFLDGPELDPHLSEDRLLDLYVWEGSVGFDPVMEVSQSKLSSGSPIKSEPPLNIPDSGRPSSDTCPSCGARPDSCATSGIIGSGVRNSSLSIALSSVFSDKRVELGSVDTWPSEPGTVFVLGDRDAIWFQRLVDGFSQLGPVLGVRPGVHRVRDALAVLDTVHGLAVEVLHPCDPVVRAAELPDPDPDASGGAIQERLQRGVADLLAAVDDPGLPVERRDVAVLGPSDSLVGLLDGRDHRRLHRLVEGDTPNPVEDLRHALGCGPRLDLAVPEVLRVAPRLVVPVVQGRGPVLLRSADRVPPVGGLEAVDDHHVLPARNEQEEAEDLHVNLGAFADRGEVPTTDLAAREALVEQPLVDVQEHGLACVRAVLDHLRHRAEERHRGVPHVLASATDLPLTRRQVVRVPVGRQVGVRVLVLLELPVARNELGDLFPGPLRLPRPGLPGLQALLLVRDELVVVLLGQVCCLLRGARLDLVDQPLLVLVGHGVIPTALGNRLDEPIQPCVHHEQVGRLLKHDLSPAGEHRPQHQRRRHHQRRISALVLGGEPLHQDPAATGGLPLFGRPGPELLDEDLVVEPVLHELVGRLHHIVLAGHVRNERAPRLLALHRIRVSLVQLVDLVEVCLR